MNRFYRKPKPETMRKNRESNKKLYSEEMEWCKEHVKDFKDNKFLVDMYTILITGSRKMTPKMIGANQKAMKNPIYDPVLSLERREKIRPIKEKISRVYKLVEMAEDKGAAVGIGHAKKSTLQVLRAEIPKLKKNGFTFQFASFAVK